MARENRLIDANDLTDRLNHATMVAYPNLFPGLLAAVEFVEDSPTVDAVEVVRCKDCGYWMQDDDIGYCINSDGLDNYARPDDFCSYGERRKE